MRPACIPAPLPQVGGMTRALPESHALLCTSASKKPTSTKAKLWSAKQLSQPVSLAFRRHPGTIPLSRRTLVMSRPSLAIMWTITEMSLGQTSTREKMLVPKGPISMGPECRMRCFLEAVTPCIRATCRHSRRPMVASVCLDRWPSGSSKTLRSELRSQ